ncbi:hypothetical protein V6N12_076183 [Hibiscus sabdariffa]|uniref:dihydrolipoyllysine-residue succinyltransferase n=1 Tax=Hibiscus sabdariffa TaxID=183260 RepID=A0ABR2AN92_9ROSI
MNFAEIEKTINNLTRILSKQKFLTVNNLRYALDSVPANVVGGNVVSRPTMRIALTYDHRLIDEREAVFFLRRIKDVVEDLCMLLLDVSHTPVAAMVNPDGGWA